MKKIICLIMTVVMLNIIFLTSCSSQDNNIKNENGSNSGLEQAAGSIETPEISETSEKPEALETPDSLETPEISETSDATEKSETYVKNLNNVMRDITTQELVYDMGFGINIGNTLDATGDWINSSEIKNYETAWGSPVITEDMIKAYADAGFRTIRIPVTWSNMMQDNYVIHPDLMNRVQQIVDWVIGNGMYAIVNIHHDGFIGELFPVDEAEGFKKFEAIWSQISERFKDYNDYLMFESMNEPGFDKIWDQYGGTQEEKEKAFDLINRINQRFVDLVRESGGNNSVRHLLISTYYTNIGHANNGLTKMPDDPVGRCAVSVHYYTPWTFVGLNKDESWGKARWEWGTEADFNELNKELDLMKDNYVDKGIPVIIGEYAVCALKEKQYSDLWTLEVSRGIYERGMCPVLWDAQLTDIEMLDGGGFFDRRTLTWVNPEALAGMQEISATRDFTKAD